jgi:hypothetical protein
MAPNPRLPPWADQHGHRSHLDSAAGGAFFSLNVKDAKDLIEKMVTNQRVE